MGGVIKQPKDLVAGLLFLGLGAFFFIEAQNYGMGNLRRMGPGWFPSAVAVCLMVTGAAIAAKSFLGSREAMPRFAWRPLILILIACGVFAALLRPAGLIPAVNCLVLLAAAGYPPVNWPRMAMVAVGLSIFCGVVFIRLLGLPMTWFGTLLGW